MQKAILFQDGEEDARKIDPSVAYRDGAKCDQAGLDHQVTVRVSCAVVGGDRHEGDELQIAP